VQKRDDRIANMVWRLLWQSPEAGHTEEYYVSLNIWREADILPAALRQALGGFQAERRYTLRFAEGQLFPAWDPEKIHVFPLASFLGGGVAPRVGRFYPRSLLPGFSGIALACRCIAVDPPNFTVDFNHPLAGVPLELDITIQEVRRLRSDTGGECRDWLDLLSAGPGMQSRWRGAPTDFFANEPFARPDEGDDTLFYEKTRLVSHVDARARTTIASLYARLLKPDMKVLDLMSSWQSHLPEDLKLQSLTGLGLNKEELGRNTQLTDHILHDLNREPRLPFGDGVFDAVVCNLSIEYLVRPEEVFAEIARVLRPGGLHIQTFSHRWFPPKAVKIWTELMEFERLGLVLELFLRAGAFAHLETFSSRGWPRPATDRYYPQFRFSDPVFAVWGKIRVEEIAGA
jgi:SAM-dependent methyltransferase/FKBP-type peptidyl-prolyl cis-trans isomerase 2